VKAPVSGYLSTGEATTQHPRDESSTAILLVQLYGDQKIKFQWSRDEHTVVNRIFNELTAAPGPCNYDRPALRLLVEGAALLVYIPVISDRNVGRLACAVDTNLAAILHAATEVVRPTFYGGSTYSPSSIRGSE
jgi:hypothetical protein